MGQESLPPEFDNAASLSRWAAELKMPATIDHLALGGLDATLISVSAFSGRRALVLLAYVKADGHEKLFYANTEGVDVKDRLRAGHQVKIDSKGVLTILNGSQEIGRVDFKAAAEAAKRATGS